jgi:hypothetical protein
MLHFAAAKITLPLAALVGIATGHADDLPNLRLFVALADNAHQRIMRVPRQGKPLLTIEVMRTRLC